MANEHAFVLGRVVYVIAEVRSSIVKRLARGCIVLLLQGCFVEGILIDWFRFIRTMRRGARMF